MITLAHLSKGFRQSVYAASHPAPPHKKTAVPAKKNRRFLASIILSGRHSPSGECLAWKKGAALRMI